MFYWSHKNKSWFGKWGRPSVWFVGLWVSPMPTQAFLSDLHESSSGPEILKGGSTVRAAGMGGAFVAVADDVGALYGNPAGLGQIDRQVFGFMHIADATDQTQNDLAYVRPVWWGNDRRTLGMRVSRLSYGSFDIVREGAADGSADPYEAVAAISYGQMWGSVMAGTTLKGVFQDLHTDRAGTWAMDAGLLGMAGPLRWGVSLLNAGPPLNYGATRIPLPLLLQGGLSGYFPLRGDVHRLLLTAQVDAPNDDKAALRAGLEYHHRATANSFLSARAGYSPDSGNGLGGIVWGFGLSWGMCTINYAYLSNELIGPGHRMDFSWRFGSRLAQEIRRDELMDQANGFLRSGRVLDAQKAVGEVLALSPNHGPGKALAREIERRISESLEPEALFLQGRRAFEEGHFSLAVEIFSKLILVDPARGNAQEWLKKSEVQLVKARKNRLQADIAKAREREKKEGFAHASQCMKEGRWEEALDHWRRVKALGGDVATEIARCQTELYSGGEKAEREGDLVTAIGLFESVSRDDGFRDAKARATRLSRELRAKRDVVVEQKYREAVALYSERKFDDAGRLFKEILTLDPDHKAARQALDHIQAELGSP